MATEKPKYVLIEGVVNGGDAVKLPKPVTKENIKQVWTVLDKTKLQLLGFIHLRTAFIESRMHDWDLTKEGKLRFYGHSGHKDEVHTLAVVYE